MTTFHFVFLSTPPMPSPLPHMCCACGKAPATGVISYAEKVHEPHCDECCEDFAHAIIAAPFGSRWNMQDFRAWQAGRGKA